MKVQTLLIVFGVAILATADNLPLQWDYPPTASVTNFTVWRRSLAITNWAEVGSSGTNRSFTVTNAMYGDQFYVLAHAGTNVSEPSNIYPPVIPVRNVRAALVPGSP